MVTGSSSTKGNLGGKFLGNNFQNPSKSKLIGNKLNGNIFLNRKQINPTCFTEPGTFWSERIIFFFFFNISNIGRENTLNLPRLSDPSLHLFHSLSLSLSISPFISWPPQSLIHSLSLALTQCNTVATRANHMCPPGDSPLPVVLARLSFRNLSAARSAGVTPAVDVASPRRDTPATSALPPTPTAPSPARPLTHPIRPSPSPPRALRRRATSAGHSPSTKMLAMSTAASRRMRTTWTSAIRWRIRSPAGFRRGVCGRY
jgi:hypothetical protein